MVVLAAKPLLIHHYFGISLSCLGRYLTFYQTGVVSCVVNVVYGRVRSYTWIVYSTTGGRQLLVCSWTAVCASQSAVSPNAVLLWGGYTRLFVVYLETLIA
ncbi:unnamed protein product [Ectocarpus sp. 12 AP-2014]